MDGHPIPQDVTGFQFKLIGAMTIKQFAYVAFGVIMSVIIYYASINILIKILLIPVFGLGGTTLAFLPVEGRPIDVMIFNFFRSIFLPNQFIYQKTGRQLSFAQSMPVSALPTNEPGKNQAYEKEQKLETFLHKQTSSAQSSLDQKEEKFLKSVASAVYAMPQAAVIQTQNTVAPQAVVPAPQTEAPKPIQTTQQPSLPQPLPQSVAQDTTVSQTTKQPVSAHPAAGRRPSFPTTQTAPQQPAKTASLLHASDTPNVIMGIVKDSRNNVLSGMLVEVKDKNGNPVRAFKTNALGQFSSATTIAPGEYTITLEDPKNQHAFSAVQIVANNQILLPIEIISHDAREELRKELFN